MTPVGASAKRRRRASDRYRLKQTTALLAVSLALASAPAFAQDSDPVEGDFTNPAGQTADINIGVDGDLFNDGSLQLEGDVSGGFDNRASGVATITGTTTISDQLSNSNVLNIADGQSLTAGSISNATTGTINIGAGARLRGVGNTLNNAGPLNVADGGTVEDAEAINNLSTGTITFNGNGTLDSDNDNAGGEVITNDGAIVINSGVGNTVAVGNDALINRGTGTLAVNSGTMSGITNLINSSTSANAINVANGATLSFGGLTSSAGTVTFNGSVNGQVNNQAGSTFDLNGALTGGLTNSGTATVAGTISAGLLNNSGGVLTFDGTSTVGGVITNAGQLTVNLGTVVDADGNVNNSGDLNIDGELDGIVNSSGGTVDITATGRLDGTLNNNGGTATVAGFANEVTNASGATANFNGAEVEDSGVNEGTANFTGASTFGDTFTNNGTATGADGASINVANTFTNNQVTQTGVGETFTVIAPNIQLGTTSTVSQGIQFVGAVTNAGLLEFDIGYDVQGGNITNTSTGTFNLNSAVDFNNFNLSNAGTTTVEAAGILTDVGSLINTGTFIVQNGGSAQATGYTNQSGATLTNSGTMSGTVTNTGTYQSNNGTLNGQLDNNTGGVATFTGNSTVDNIANSGTVNLAAPDTLAVTNGLTNESGGVVNSSGTVTGSIINSGTANMQGIVTQTFDNQTGGVLTTTDDLNVGTLQNTGTVNVQAGDTLTSGNAVQNQSGGVANLVGDLDADVTNAGTFNMAGGDVTGDVTNTGAVNVTSSGTISGDLNNNAGSTTIDAGDTLTVSGTTSNGNGANLNVNGTLISSITNAGNLTLGNGLVGSLGSTDGVVVLNGAITGNLNVTGGTFALAGNSSVTGSNMFTSVGNVAAGQTFTAPTTTIGSGGVFTNAGTVVSDVTTQSGGQFVLDGLVTGNVVNGGTFNAANGSRVAGNYSSSGTTNLTMNNAVGDVFTINGDLVGTPATLSFDVDLQDAGFGAVNSDRVDVTGSVTGRFLINLNLVNTNYGEQAENIVLINADSDNTGDVSNFTFGLANVTPTSEGSVQQNTFAPNTGDFVYSLQIADSGANSGDLVLVSQLNPGIAGLSGNVALSQSLIGSIVNRPSSPFVSGLAAPAEETCGEGAWTRTVAGRAEATGVTSGALNSFPSTLTASYYGAQFGLDVGCYQGHFNEWDLSFGVIGGFNNGRATQPVFAIDPLDPTRLTNVRVGTTRSDFAQVYGGFYGTAAKGAFAADLQFRKENTEFTLNNPDIALNDTKFNVRGTTLSGAVSYAFRPKKLEGWSLIPTAGFSVTQTKTTPIVFDDGDTIEVDDHSPKVVFIGGTAAKVKIAESGLSATNYFVTTTYYFDQSDQLMSTFNGGSGPEVLTSDSLGDYGEISAGWSLIKILEPGDNDRATRQFNASIRADARFSDDLTSYGITGQIRWQF